MDDSLETDRIRLKCTITRPLLGITILLVEDSHYCSEAMRLLSIRSGARLRRADNLKSARRHLRIYRPDVLLVDLGLPDGSGLELIKEVTQAATPFKTVIATSGNIEGSVRDEALHAGAVFFMEKPIVDLAGFQQTLLAALPEEIKPAGFTPRLAGACVRPDAQAMKDDLDHIDALLKDCHEQNDEAMFAYIVQFLNSLGRDADNKDILEASRKLRDLAQKEAFFSDTAKQEFRIIRQAIDGHTANFNCINTH